MSHRRERGQLLLITAIAMGLLLVVLAVLLNTVMHADALAAAGTTSGAERDLTTYLTGMEAGIGSLVGAVNANQSGTVTVDELEDATADAVHEWSDQARTHWLHDGTWTNVTMVDLTVHTRIVDDNGSTDFTDATGETDWLLIDEADAIDGFEMTVVRDTLTTVNDSCSPGGDCFTIVFEGGDLERSTLHIADRAGTVYLELAGPAGETDCTVDAEAVTIDFVAGTVDGEPCDGLAIVGHHAPPYRLQYADAGNASGVYTIGVHGTVADPSRFDAEGTPRVIATVDSVEVAVTYESGPLAYQGTHTVAAGAGDD